jgi:hypothetical protein
VEPSAPPVKAGNYTIRSRDVTPVQSYTYEITFAGQAGDGLCAEFDDCEITVGRNSTTLHADLPDQAALAGLVLRITSLRLKVTHLRLVAPPLGSDLARAAAQDADPDVSHACALSPPAGSGAARASRAVHPGAGEPNNRGLRDPYVVCIPL